MTTFVMNLVLNITSSLAKEWTERLGQQLLKAIAGVCPELLTNYNAPLAIMIHDYVFAREMNELELKNLIICETKKNRSFKQKHLPILFLTLKGARLTVLEENMVSPKEFDKYMLEKQAIVQKMIDKRLHEKELKNTDETATADDRDTYKGPEKTLHNDTKEGNENN